MGGSLDKEQEDTVIKVMLGNEGRDKVIMTGTLSITISWSYGLWLISCRLGT